jgi:hypothetical protein
MKGACQAEGAPSMFPDDWGDGRSGRALRSQALALCRECPSRRACALGALAEYAAGLGVYGVRAGVVFGDAQRPDVSLALLRRQVTS